LLENTFSFCFTAALSNYCILYHYNTNFEKGIYMYCVAHPPRHPPGGSRLPPTGIALRFEYNQEAGCMDVTRSRPMSRESSVVPVCGVDVRLPRGRFSLAISSPNTSAVLSAEIKSSNSPAAVQAGRRYIINCH